ncbi:MAG: M28 family peptidase [Flavobacteriaceae bacterium]|nr:M28 family peptidase [Flavobacteriaceae bacterium]
MIKFFFIFLAITFFSCKSQKNLTANDYLNKTEKYASGILQSEIKEMLYVYAGDDFVGRDAASEGERLATEYIRDFYIKNQIPPVPDTKNYYQTIPDGTFSRVNGDANNVIAYIPGTDKANEIIVISAHLDHIGTSGEKIYNGADDNGSGTIAVMNMAKAFKKAEKQGFKPRRTIVFLHITAEEKGLLGAKYYSDNPLFPLKNTITNLNIDMIGRVDKEHIEDENYIYLIGSEVLSKDLKQVAEKVNQDFFQLNLDYRFDAPDDPNRFYFRSDHYHFAKNNIPVIFFFNGVHEDYHKETDTADKINYPLLTRRTQLIFSIAWTLANADEKPKLNTK